MLRPALMILSGNAGASLLLLLRNLIVAHLIPLGDYGIASTFAVAMAVVEMVSSLGLQQQIVQAADGNDPRFQAALQGFQVLRGVMSGVGLLILAGPMAAFMGIKDTTWAFQVLALVPVLNAFQHFDIYRFNREMVFGPMMLTGLVPALLSVLVLWPLAHWLGDWQVMLWSIMVQAALGAVTSHLVARRPYRLILDRQVMARSLRFGWPLLANGALLFLVFNGEKLIVGREMRMEVLAIFSMGVTLTLTPTLVLAKSAQNLFLPLLARAAATDRAVFERMAVVVIQAILWSSLAFVVAMAFLGEPVIGLVLGSKYHDLGAYIVPLSLMQAIRVFKAGPAIIAMARGKTMNTMMPNVLRVMLLPLGWYFATTGAGLMAVLWVGIAGEALGQIVATLMLVRTIRLGQFGLLLPLGATALTVALTSALIYFNVGRMTLAGWLLVAFLLSSLTMVALWSRVARRSVT